MPLNARMDAVGDYSFDRLRALLGGIEPPEGVTPIALSLGEPQHAPPAFLAETVAREAAGWSKYPPIRGTEAARAAIAGWLSRRYGLPDGMIDPETMVIPVSGTREALFMIALAAVPEEKNGQKPVVLMPNPFYQVYLGATVIADVVGADVGTNVGTDVGTDVPPSVRRTSTTDVKTSKAVA